MPESAYLILEDGTVFKGNSFGAAGETVGELVFTTGMTGYLETLTDPSYYGQIILQTFPLIGNYGVIPEDFESAGIAAKAYITRHPCKTPSNFRSECSLDEHLKKQGIIGLCDIDTRSLTKHIREKGSMNGKITKKPPTDSDKDEAEKYRVENAIASVSSKTITKTSQGTRRVALLDYGAKRGIPEALAARDCEVWIYPHDCGAQTILKDNPRGIMLSNGPGDPADPANTHIINTIKQLLETKIPIFGICMGHQLLALAHGKKTKKLKFGHRGANQPVKDMRTGRVYITSQNHSYTVETDGSSFINVNDSTCEGFDYGNSFSVQFHPEARGGPLDTGFLFDSFMERMDAYAAQ